MRNVSDKSCRENHITYIKTHFIFTNFFFFENRDVYELISVSESVLAFFYRRCYVLCRLIVMDTRRHSVECVLLRTKSN